MALVVEQPIATFDLSEIARGDLVYGNQIKGHEERRRTSPKYGLHRRADQGP